MATDDLLFYFNRESIKVPSGELIFARHKQTKISKTVVVTEVVFLQPIMEGFASM